METSIGKAAMRLIELGIKEYKRQISVTSECIHEDYPTVKVKSALIDALGYTSFEDMIAQINPKGGVA
jgi:hypothetical protein